MGAQWNLFIKPKLTNEQCDIPSKTHCDCCPWSTDFSQKHRQHQEAVGPNKLLSVRWGVIFLKTRTYQGNERRRAAPEQHPGDTEGLSLERWMLLGRFSTPFPPYGEAEDWAKQSAPLLPGGYGKRYKGQKAEHRMGSEELSLQQQNSI